MTDNYCTNLSRDKFIEENTGLVHSIVKRYLGRGYEYDDLFQTGCIGLCKAAERFNPDLGYNFSTYAVPLIMGEIRRFLRDDGIIKVSRHYKEINLKAGIAINSFVQKHGREPTLSELSEECGISCEDLSAALEASQLPVSIYGSSDSDDTSEIDSFVSDKFNDEIFVDKLALCNIISSFIPRDRNLIIYRYFKDKTQSETAKLLGISQVQVSRIEKRLLERIRILFSG